MNEEDIRFFRENFSASSLSNSQDSERDPKRHKKRHSPNPYDSDTRKIRPIIREPQRIDDQVVETKTKKETNREPASKVTDKAKLDSDTLKAATKQKVGATRTKDDKYNEHAILEEPSRSHTKGVMRESLPKVEVRPKRLTPTRGWLEKPMRSNNQRTQNKQWRSHEKEGDPGQE